jgi:alpha-ketoglutarate-dependent taurine dioxygenase
MDMCVAPILEEIAGRRILLNVEPSQRPTGWAEENKSLVKDLLHGHGALLLRGMRFHGTRQFGRFMELLFDEGLAEYRYRSTPRTLLGGNVYTATEYHPDETIPQHNESSYAHAWPMYIGFFCLVPPAAGAGGATPLADSRRVLERIPSEIVAKFEEKGVQYVRNYGDIDLPWSEVFQTEDRTLIEDFCNENRIAFEWTPGNGLRTRQVNPATIDHPITGEKLWFNQAHLFHVSALGEQLARNMLASYEEIELPRNVYFGDGSPIEASDLEIIRQAYRDETFHFDWCKHDVLLLDNMLFTHGRQPYHGERKILVGMSGTHGHG